MSSRCRLCLIVDSTLENFSGNAELYNKIKSVFPKMDLTLVKDPKLCQICLRRIHYSYNFRQCVNIAEKKIRSQLALNDKTKNILVKNLQSKCRICIKAKPSVDLSPIFKISGFSEMLIRSMITESVISLDYDLFENPLICNTCWIIINQICTFKKDYYENERKLKLYSKKLNKSCLEESDVEFMIVSNCDIKEEPLTDCIMDNLINNQIEDDDDTFNEDEGKLGKVPKKEPEEIVRNDEENDDVFVEDPSQKNPPLVAPEIVYIKEEIHEQNEDHRDVILPEELVECNIYSDTNTQSLIEEPFGQQISSVVPNEVSTEHVSSHNRPEEIPATEQGSSDKVIHVAPMEEHVPSDNVPRAELIDQVPSDQSDKVAIEEPIGLMESSDIPEECIPQKIPSDPPDKVITEEHIIPEEVILEERVEHENASDQILPEEFIELENLPEQLNVLVEELIEPNITCDRVVPELIQHEKSSASNQPQSILPELIELENSPTQHENPHDVHDKILPAELRIESELPDKILPEELTEHENSQKVPDKVVSDELMEHENSQDIPDKVLQQEIIEQENSQDIPGKVLPKDLVEQQNSQNILNEVLPEAHMEPENSQDIPDKVLPKELLEKEHSQPDKVLPEELVEHGNSQDVPDEVLPEELIEVENSTELPSKDLPVEFIILDKDLPEVNEHENPCVNVLPEEFIEHENSQDVPDKVNPEELMEHQDSLYAPETVLPQELIEQEMSCDKPYKILPEELIEQKKVIKSFKENPSDNVENESNAGNNMDVQDKENNNEMDLMESKGCAKLKKAKREAKSKQKKERQRTKQVKQQYHYCKHCNYTSANLQHFKRHMLVHKNKKSLKMFKCPHCSYETYRNDHLKTHCLTHGKGGEIGKMYNCDMCEYVSNRRYSLKRHHMQVHDKHVKKTFKCSECSYVGKRKTDLDSHMKTHIKKLDFECLVCGYKAIRKSSLKTHMLKHEDAKRFECGRCGYKTNRKEHLKLHITTVQCKPKVENLK